MDEYIKRKSAIGWAVSGQILTFPHTEDGEKWIRVNEVRESLQSVPAADVRPVRRGKWTLNKDGSGTCSECGFVQNSCWDLDNWDNFCHHCGADMREKS